MQLGFRFLRCGRVFVVVERHLSRCSVCHKNNILSPQPAPLENVDIDGKKFPRDNWTNVNSNVLKVLARHGLHKQKSNPLNLLTGRIREHFYDNYKRRNRSPLFSYFDSFSPVVSVWQNFDSLLIPNDHPSRSRNDTYYINSEFVLRGHTSAHQHELITSGLDHFLVVGDVYRRDTIDRNHYPCFHQMEGVYLFNDQELFRNWNGNKESLCLFENNADGKRTIEKQERHTFDCSYSLQSHLKSSLESLVKDLFGRDVKCRWTDAYFPFTHPSFELEILYNDEWLETLGCGVIEQKLLENAGAGHKVGWAFGLGLERLAMKLYEIPDIRLFWSTDSAFASQFSTSDCREPIVYKPISKFPKKLNDMSMWLSSVDDGRYSVSDFYDLVRTIGEDLIEHVEMFDDFVHPKTKLRSHCFRITYRHMERALLQSEISVVHAKIGDEAEKNFGVTIRR